MKFPKSLIVLTGIACMAGAPIEAFALCDHSVQFCGWYKGGGRSVPPSPSSTSTGGGLGVNPSAVPVESGFGIGSIAYKGQWDVSLVKGLGRVGAAISPSNSEETFFGPPGFELPEEFELRKLNSEKYPGQKMTLATAFSIIDNDREGLGKFELNLGAMGTYNKLTKNTNPGGGVSGIAGPFTFGYSAYKDESLLDYKIYGLDLKEKIPYTVETYSAGIFLTYLALDYSVLRVIESEVSTITLLTGTLITGAGMFTAATRTEVSDRLSFNYKTKQAEAKREKQEVFLGAQFNLTKDFLIGAYYNYYVLREVSAGFILFF